jgi:hypothetical protein
MTIVNMVRLQQIAEVEFAAIVTEAYTPDLLPRFPITFTTVVKSKLRKVILAWSRKMRCGNFSPLFSKG